MRKITLQEFIESSNKQHNHKYDYSLVVLVNTTTKVKIICPEHGIFEQTPQNHKNGSECVKCSYESRQSTTKLDTNKFINKAVTIHNNVYDYSLTEYKTTHDYVKIICSIHGVFEQTPAHHLNGSGCKKCGNDVKTKEYAITKSKEVHGDYYDYSLVDFINTKKKVIIICPIHGEFKQTLGHHYNGAGCPICCESKGERDIRKYLTSKKIIFTPQKRFKDCRDKLPLPFDFYLPKYNICIEYDGEQHFKSKEQWGGHAGFLDRQKKDQIKTEYCKINNINLIRITNIKDLKIN